MSDSRADVASLSDDTPVGLDLLQLGVAACVLVFIRGAVLGAEQHMYPKELMLHLFAFGAGAACLSRARRLAPDAVDLALAGLLVLSVLAVPGATNRWLALIGTGVAVSGLVVFWSARSLAAEGFERQVLLAAAVAVSIAAFVSLLEAYGVVQGLSSLNRAPGGTMGSRNRMAHLLVLGMPTLVLLALRARSRARFSLGAAALAAATAALVLSRTRAAWLAALVVVALAAVLVAWRWRTLRTLGSRPRAALLAAAVLFGGAVALLAPNWLEWRSGSPHLESLRGIADYQSGSGRGRLIQYANTLRMVRDHPMGVGPRNWMVEYPRYASPGDPSVHSEALLPISEFPQSDWIGIAAERGVPALLLLLGVGGVAFARGLRRLAREGDPAVAARGLVLLLLLAALAVVGALDPVLQTPTAAFLAFLLLGALVPPGRPRFGVALTGRRRALGVAVVVAAGLVPATASARQLGAVYLYSGGLSPELLQTATRISPQDYRAHFLLAYLHAEAGACDRARPHIERAHRLYPTAPGPVRLRERCRQPDPPR